MMKIYLIGIIGFLLIIWVQSCSNLKKNNKYINIFNKIKLPLLLVSILLYVYDDFNLGVKFQTDDSVLNNLYTEPANF